MRGGQIRRATSETDIQVGLALEGGPLTVSTSFRPLDHMLTSLLLHGRFGAEVQAAGDIDVDPHHLVEDMGRVFGEALDAALGERVGIRRFGSALVPMDEALGRAVVDLSGRSYAAWRDTLEPGAAWAGLPLTGWREFFRGLARGGRLTIHLDILAGDDPHHALETIFKATGIALASAVEDAGGGLPSTKGSLT